MKTMLSGVRPQKSSLGLAIALSAVLLTACGGGGSSGLPPLAVPPAPPAPSAQINGSNYLDAAAVGSIGRNRALELASLLDFSFSVGVSSNFTTANFTCPSGGSLSLVVASSTSNTATPNNCNLGTVLLVSGSIQVTDLQVITSGNPPRTDLSRGTYRVLDQVNRALPGDGVNQTYNASVAASRQADASVTITGPFSVLRNARADSYSGLVLNVSKPSGTVTTTGMSFEASTPRFAVQPLRVVAEAGASPVLRVTAPDGSYVRVTTLAPGSGNTPAQLRFEVFPSASATTPTVSQTLAENDPAVSGALTRALQ